MLVALRSARQVRHDVRLAVKAADQAVGSFIVLEALVLPVYLQPRPKCYRPGVNVDFVGRKVLQQPVEHVVENRGVLDLGVHLFLRGLPAEPVRDVAGMADGGGKVAFKDICVEVFAATAADRLDEVDEMVAAAAKRLDLFSVVVPRDAAEKTHRTCLAIDDDAHPLATKRRHFAGALGFTEVVHFIKQRGGGEVIVDYLRVGDIAGVVEQEPAADAHYPTRQHGFAQTPPGYIHLVDALIAGLPITCVPVEAAIILEPVAIYWHFPGGAAPKVIVNSIGDRKRSVAFSA